MSNQIFDWYGGINDEAAKGILITFAIGAGIVIVAVFWLCGP